MGKIVQHTWEEIKGFSRLVLAEWGLFLLVLLLGVGSFALGRLSALEASRPLITLTEAPQTAMLPIANGGLYVASRTGSVYYFPWCAGAEKIAPANQRWFQNADEAERAGYRAAKNCKGM